MGVVERGWYDVRDVVKEQPWLPNGPINYTVTWRHPEYLPAAERATAGVPASPGAPGMTEGSRTEQSTVTGRDETAVGSN